MKRLVADWQGLCYREGGVWCTCRVYGLCLTRIRDLERRHCAMCDSGEIHSGPAHTVVPLWLSLPCPLSHRYNVWNMWLGDPDTQPKAGGCIEEALALVKLCWFSEDSLCLEGVWLFGLILWMCVSQRTESRKWHIHQPPSVMSVQTPSHLIWEFSFQRD